MKWADWGTALAAIENPALVAYYRQQLEANRESYLRKRILHYRLDGKRRWFVTARRTKAYAWQHGRFDGDVDFWRGGMSTPDDVKPVKDSQRLRFFLTTEDDFRFFHEAATKKLTAVEWTSAASEEEMDDTESEDQ